MGKTMGLSDFTMQIEGYLDKVGKDFDDTLEKALDEAAALAVQELKASSPKATGKYANSWKVSGKEKGIRHIINDCKVKWKNNSVSLASIFRYSTKHRNTHIVDTQKKIRPKILKILKDAIK